MTRTHWHRVAYLCYGALMAVVAVWELVLAPADVVPRAVWFVIKELPLAFGIRGLAQDRDQTYEWTVILIPLYLVDSLLGLTISRNQGWGLASRLPSAGVELAVSLGYFIAALRLIRLGRVKRAED